MTAGRVRPGDRLRLPGVESWHTVIRVVSRYGIPVAECVGDFQITLDDDGGYPLGRIERLEDGPLAVLIQDPEGV